MNRYEINILREVRSLLNNMEQDYGQNWIVPASSKEVRELVKELEKMIEENSCG